MEENARGSSSDSLPTSEEFDFLVSTSSPPDPCLQVDCSASDLENKLTEVLQETDEVDNSSHQPAIEVNAPNQLDLQREVSDSNICSMSSAVLPDSDNTTLNASFKKDVAKTVGKSTFYESNMKSDESSISPSSPAEKQDHMKPTDSDEEVSDVDQECTMFSGVSYLGAATINAPKSEQELQRYMAMLSEQRESEMGIAVTVSIPSNSQGLVILYDAATNAVMARYAINRISFFARGVSGTPQASCFAFTWFHGDSKESAVFQCHVFKCHIVEAVSQVSSCFSKAFEPIPRSMVSSLMSDSTMSCSIISAPSTSIISETSISRSMMHVLECNVEIRESDNKGSFIGVPKKTVGFKLRAGIDKQVFVNVHQVSPNSQLSNEPGQMTGSISSSGLVLERCFGILVAPGRNVKHTDMHLLEMDSGGGGNASMTGTNYCSASGFWKASEPSLTMLNNGNPDPIPIYMTIAIDLVIRGMTEPVRLVVETPVKIYPPTERFWYVSKRPLIQQFFITMKETTNNKGVEYEVVNMETSGEIDRNRLSLTLSLSSLLPSPLIGEAAPPSPDDEVSDGDEPLQSGTGEVSKYCCSETLNSWREMLASWKDERPKNLQSLVRLGIPEALRGAIWQRLADTDKNNKLMDEYRTLITKDCPCESVILRDIARTFPAHYFFKEAGGLGQDSLLRLTRAYAVYDAEVGYCQGLSFVAATLLLHMPEEQAFCVLVALMYKYGLRELYKHGFENLTLRLYQLNRLMEERMPDLRAHFMDVGVEPHMFASQWFLSLFTAKFPLPLVFHIMDVFLLQGIDTIFQIALALLSRSKKDLLQLDFEGILKYIRVTMPKKYRPEEASKQIIKDACAIKVKRLAKFQQELEAYTQEVNNQESAHISNDLENLKAQYAQLEQEKAALDNQLIRMMEIQQKEKEMMSREVAQNAEIVQSYKDICSRIQKQLAAVEEVIQGCNTCSSKLKASTGDNKIVETKQEGEIGAQQKIRELEIELAQVKLAHVQAQCNNQELTHQLNTTLSEYQTVLANQKQSWPPWLSKTIGSIKEAAQNSRPTFQTYLLAGVNTSQSNDLHNQPQIKRQDSLPVSLVHQTEDLAQKREVQGHSPQLLKKRISLQETNNAAVINQSKSRHSVDSSNASIG